MIQFDSEKSEAQRVREAVEFLQEYWKTYTDQPGWKEYWTKTLIEDALYGVGAALGEEFRGADGFDRFKRELVEYLT